MKNHKSLLVLAIALAVAPLAHAWDSPEIGLILDNISTGAFQVDRYDLSSGLSLGDFATSTGGYSSAIGIQEVGNLTHVFTESFSNIDDNVYNMSTGQFLTSTIVGSAFNFGNVNSVQWIQGASGNGAYLVQADSSTPGSWYEYDTDYSSLNAIDFGNGTTMGQLSFNAATSTMAYSVKDSSGITTAYYATLDQANQQLSPLGSGSRIVVSDNSYLVANNVSIALDGGQSPLNSTITYNYSDAGNGYGHINDFVPVGGAYSPTYGTGQGTNDIDFAAFGHTQNLYDLNFASGVAHIRAYHAQAGNINDLRQFSITGLNNPLDFTVYAAPEPKAPLLILTPFVFAFVAYRRKR